MDPKQLFYDKRLDFYCCYCGNINPNTTDHVPSKVLLDEPYGANLPTVTCCKSCNNSFSKDEVYFACILECIMSGSISKNKLNRDKIKRIFEEMPYLYKRICSSFIKTKNESFFKIEWDRFESIIIKLAKGHLKYECCETAFMKPSYISIKSINAMNESELSLFFDISENTFLPELGSRAYKKVMINENKNLSIIWSIVQENVYAYRICYDNRGRTVKMLIRNYLACEVTWE